ncbi:hypothetical protein LPY66_07690 [Dehalobacter sp. DCM]|uniref:hypothetical protein n=1 Tax=Dehalobacter sp. DCM TaxID=2907827 RepID=UPI003081BD07|nr:hypothetical protein LPY66_07690 [Dehalobacter sp. DCM]
MLEIKEKSIIVRIDTSKCDCCDTKACVAACKKYARGILQVDEGGKPSVAHLGSDEILRLGTECLACEIACQFEGNKALKITVPIEGIDAYLAKRTDK